MTVTFLSPQGLETSSLNLEIGKENYNFFINENRKRVNEVLFGGSDCHDIELTGNLESRAIAVVSSRSTLQAVRASTCYQLGHSISANF